MITGSINSKARSQQPPGPEGTGGADVPDAPQVALHQSPDQVLQPRDRHPLSLPFLLEAAWKGGGGGGGVGGRIPGFLLYVCALFATDREIPGWRLELQSPRLRRTEMEPEDTGCHGGWDGKGSLEGLLGPPLDTLCPQSWIPSLLFSRFLSKMVALLSSEPTCRLLA